jgi:WD40 repeat protein
MLGLTFDPTGTGDVAGAHWGVRDLPSGAEVFRVRNPSLVRYACDFSPDGRFLAVGADRGQAEVWDLDAEALVFRWQPHGGKTVQFLSFGPDGDIATVADGDDRLVVLRMKEVRARLGEIGLGW